MDDAFLKAFSGKLFEEVMRSGVSKSQIVEALTCNNGIGLIRRLSEVFVRYTDDLVPKSLFKILAECRFKHVNPRINDQSFPVGDVRYAEIQRGSAMTYQDLGSFQIPHVDIETAIRQKGHRPGVLIELLAYARNSWNRQDLVVALGSRALGTHYNTVPYLSRNCLLLHEIPPNYRWPPDTRFLAISETLPQSKRP